MIFSSIEFILIFLPITGFLFWLSRQVGGITAALGMLAMASIIFYGVWMPQDVPLLLCSIVANYFIAWFIGQGPHRRASGRMIGTLAAASTLVVVSYLVSPSAAELKTQWSDSWMGPTAVDLLLGIVRSVQIAFPMALAFALISRVIPQSRDDLRSKVALAIGLVGNVALLFWFKYSRFASEVAVDLGILHAPFAKHFLPLGISFFTFVQIAYLVDRHRGLAPLASFGRYLLFVSFFPHLIAGPIVHHAQMMPQLERPEPNWDLFTRALFIFAIGLAKKTLIADPLGVLADEGFGAAHSLAVFNAWAVVLAYTFQLYFDFSGYSDMAIGLALMFGVQFPWNFLSPYKCTSISQFWRYWHITLSNFLKDYIYIPLGGSRRGTVRTSINLMITMVLGGIWHGAGWPFMLWGALHGMALVINHLWKSFNIALPKLLGWIITMTIVIGGWVLFRAANMHDAAAIYGSMFGRAGSWMEVNDTMVTALPYLLVAAAIALGFPNTKELSERFRPSFVWAVGTGAMACLCMVYILGKVSAPEFLYYDF